MNDSYVLDLRGPVALQLDDGTVEIPADTSREERERIIADVRSRHPEVFENAPDLEQLILGMSDLRITEQSTPEDRRRAVDTLKRMGQHDPGVEQAILEGDFSGLEHQVIAQGPAPARDVPAPEAGGPVHAQRSLLQRLFGRGG